MSMADLVVLAGTTAVEKTVDVDLAFCPGRVDHADGSMSDSLSDGPLEDGTDGLRDYYQIMGLSAKETVALVKGLGMTDTLQNLTGEGRSDYSLALGTFEGDEFATLSLKDMFGRAWTKLMNADRYLGACDSVTNKIPAFSGKTEL